MCPLYRGVLISGCPEGVSLHTHYSDLRGQVEVGLIDH